MVIDDSDPMVDQLTIRTSTSGGLVKMPVCISTKVEIFGRNYF